MKGKTVIFPDILIVRAVDDKTGDAVENVALTLRLEAQKKNDYFVGPVITDGNGQAEFSRVACERAIAASQKMFLMDYYGDLATCGPTVHVGLLLPENLRRMLHQYEESPQFWGMGFDSPEALFFRLRTVCNDAYAPAQLAIRSSEILKHPEATLVLQRGTH